MWCPPGRRVTAPADRFRPRDGRGRPPPAHRVRAPSGLNMITRETTNVIGTAAAAATSGAYRLPNPARSTSTQTPPVVMRKLAALVSGKSRNFRQVGRVR